MSFNSCVKQTLRTASLHLCNIAKIIIILSQNDAFVPSRLDYCNPLFPGCSNKSIKALQLIQNAATHLLTATQKRDLIISPVLASLHWLPVKTRIEFKILLLAYKALNGSTLLPY